MESLLGLAQEGKSAGMARALRVCIEQQATVFYHALDANCAAGDTQLAFFGFVH